VIIKSIIFFILLGCFFAQCLHIFYQSFLCVWPTRVFLLFVKNPEVRNLVYVSTQAFQFWHAMQQGLYAHWTRQMSIKDRPISFFWNRYRYFQIFSPIFGQLPIFDWPPIPIILNLVTDILTNILVKDFSDCDLRSLISID